MIGTLLETLRALAPVVTPGPLMAEEDPCDGRDYKVLVTTKGTRSFRGTWVMRAEHNCRDADYGERRISWKEATANASATALLLSNLPAIIAALEVAELVRDEDWLAERISDTLDMDWRPIDAARAIIAALPKEEV